MKTAISIPDSLFEQAELVAKRLHVSRSELYAKALATFLASHRAQGVTEILNRIYAEKDSTLDPVLARMQAASLPRGW